MTSGEPAAMTEITLAERRRHLRTTANPDQRQDYVVSLTGALRLDFLGRPVGATMRYVPDTLTLERAAFTAYLDALSAAQWASLEAVATTMLADVNNELVPRWVYVRLAAEGDGERYSVTLEDRQPHWKNPSLLAHLGPP